MVIHRLLIARLGLHRGCRLLVIYRLWLCRRCRLLVIYRLWLCRGGGLMVDRLGLHRLVIHRLLIARLGLYRGCRLLVDRLLGNLGFHIHRNTPFQVGVRTKWGGKFAAP